MPAVRVQKKTADELNAAKQNVASARWYVFIDDAQISRVGTERHAAVDCRQNPTLWFRITTASGGDTASARKRKTASSKCSTADS
jgi:hypothetical protein